MHYVTVPEPVTIENLDPATPEGEPPKLSMAHFIRYTLATNKAWRATETTIGMLTSVVAKFDAAKPGSVVELEDDEWETLLRIGQGHDYNAQVVVFLMPLLRAIVAAPKKRPKPKEPPAVTEDRSSVGERELAEAAS